MNLNKQIQAAELELLGSSTRTKPARMGELLHPEFIEIGRSLATYRLRTPAGPAAVPGSPVEPGPVSRHSSVWDISAPQARLRFHQGTVILPNS